jgi:Do/DeqQ family serine protease
MRRNSKSIWIAAVAVAAVAGGFVAGHLFSTASVAGTEGDPAAMPLRSDGTSVLADVAEAVGPGVVFIRTERAFSRDDRDRGRSFEFFREFFPDTDRENPHWRRDGGGSGFIFDNEGRILTNHHVIRDADRITVVMAGGSEEEEYDAEIVGYDVHTDIAIVKIDPPRTMTVIPLGDSDDIRVGDWVMAIGTPFGQLQGTVTAGIVSAKGRTDLNIVGGEATYQNYIQTDASINFGNSGGPLVNMRGEAVGINTAINPSGQGIGFAIPINMARRVMTQLIESGRVSYGFLGIRLRELNEELAEGLGLDLAAGILVEDVIPNRPAAAAGMEQGDVIVRFDGEDVSDDNRFRLKVGNTPPGTVVPVEVIRDGRRVEMEVTLGERPDRDVVASAEPPEAGDSWLGLRVDDASKNELRRRYSLERGQEGVVVVGVREGSPADEAGIREGDIITEVYSHEVNSLQDYVEISDKLKDREAPIAFLVKRGRSTTYVPVRPGGRR